MRLVSRQLANRFGATRDVTSEGGEIGGEVSGCVFNVFCHEKSPGLNDRRCRGVAADAGSLERVALASAAPRARLPLSVTIFCGDHAKTNSETTQLTLKAAAEAARQRLPSSTDGDAA